MLLKFPQTTVTEVLAAMSQSAGFELELKGEKPTAVITVDWPKITVKEALVRLGREQSLRFEVPTPKKLVVRFAKK